MGRIVPGAPSREPPSGGRDRYRPRIGIGGAQAVDRAAVGQPEAPKPSVA